MRLVEKTQARRGGENTKQGGKPSLPGVGRPKNDFCKMIREVAEVGKEVKVFMNGYLVDDHGEPYGNAVKVLVKIPAMSAIIMKAFKQTRRVTTNALE